MIKLKPMPTITPAFLRGLIVVAQERLKYFMKYPVVPRSPHDNNAVNRATTIKYLIPMARQERSSLDLLLTRLRKLDYVSFDFEINGSDLLKDGRFICKTVPLIMVDNSGRMGRDGTPDSWEIGEYIVNVPVYGVLNAALDTFKMRPNRNDLREELGGHGSWGYAYHPHHCAKNTCWSQWIQPLTEGCRNCNFDMLFGAFTGFLKSYNSGSPLATPPRGDYSTEPDIPLFWMKPL